MKKSPRTPAADEVTRPLDEITRPIERGAFDVGELADDLQALVKEYVSETTRIAEERGERTVVTPAPRAAHKPSPALRPSEHRHDTEPYEAVRLPSSEPEENTSPGLMPAPKTGANAAGERRGDIAQLLQSVGPFLWSLEGAERWVRAHGAGDVEAEGYARALGLLARVLGQLQARIDEASQTLR